MCVGVGVGVGGETVFDANPGNGVEQEETISPTRYIFRNKLVIEKRRNGWDGASNRPRAYPVGKIND